jgi:hypothetical protein
VIVEIELDGGEKAEVCTFEGHILTFLSPRAFASGAPIGFAVVVGDHRRAFEGRCVSARRVEDGRFKVRVRLVNLRRDARRALGEAVRLSST